MKITEDRMRTSLVIQHKDLLAKLRRAEVPFTSKQLKEDLGSNVLLIARLKMYGLIACFRPIEEARFIYYVITKRACELLDSQSPQKIDTSHREKK